MRTLFLFLLCIIFSIVGYSQSKMSTNTSLLLMSLKHDTLSIENSKKIDKRFAVRSSEMQDMSMHSFIYQRQMLFLMH